VNSDDGEFGFRIDRFFFDAQDPISIQLRNAKTLRIRHPLQQNFRATRLAAIAFDGRADISLDDVVAQNNAYRIMCREMLDQTQGVGNATLALLISVIQVFEPKGLAISE